MNSCHLKEGFFEGLIKKNGARCFLGERIINKECDEVYILVGTIKLT